MTHGPGALVTISPGAVDNAVLEFYLSVLLPAGSVALPPLLSGPYVCQARNQAVRLALAREAEWVLFIDADQECRDRHAVLQLLDWQEPIVSAVVAERAVPYRLPAFSHVGVGETQRLTLAELQPRKLTRAVAVGMGFVLVRRAVFEALGDPWFRPAGEVNGMTVGEDLDFTHRASEKGFGVFVDGGLEVGHRVRAMVWPRVSNGLTYLVVNGDDERWVEVR